ncbi:TPA: YdaE family protein [Raoultella ornithinolytica]
MQKKCAYCRKPIEEGQEVKMTILITQGTQLAPRERTYCSKRCGEYDAMANEA